MFNDTTIYSFRGPMGVRVDIGQSLIYLVGLFLYMGLNGNILYSVILIGMLLLSIFLHELGHAWGAIVQGVPVRRVMIYGGGGFCQPARSVSRYEDELFTLAGPLVNLALWAISGIVSYLLYQYGPMTTFVDWVIYYLWIFGQLNLVLFCLNLVPVLPLDGGRLFHLLLCRLMSFDIATRIAGGVGLVISVLWIPGMIWLYLTFGWALLIIPPIRPNLTMLRHGVRV